MKKLIAIISIAITLINTALVSSEQTIAAIDCAGLNNIPGISSADYDACMKVEGNYDSTKTKKSETTSPFDCAGLNNIPGISSADYDACMKVKGNYDSTKTKKSGAMSTLDSNCEYFLGMVSWDCNVDIHDENSLKSSIWVIASNIASDIAIAASYLLIAYVIYGGYLYVFSRGEPGKVAEGKKTLTQAFIGFGIVMFAAIILNSIRIALGNVVYNQNCATENCVDPSNVVVGFINWVIGVAGIMSVIFVVYGGLLYITSAGDPNKVKQAKNMITYSLIGLAIVALSATITAFVSRSLQDASESALLNNTLISKEVHEIKNH